MRSTLIFRGVPETEYNDTWEEVTQNLISVLAKKLRLDPAELDLQISRAHRTPKSPEDNSNSRPIFAQFVNWRYADDIRRSLIRLHANKESKIIVSQMFSKELTQRCNEALKRRKEILAAESNDLNIYLEFPARLMARKKKQ